MYSPESEAFAGRNHSCLLFCRRRPSSSSAAGLLPLPLEMVYFAEEGAIFRTCRTLLNMGKERITASPSTRNSSTSEDATKQPSVGRKTREFLSFHPCTGRPFRACADVSPLTGSGGSAGLPLACSMRTAASSSRQSMANICSGFREVQMFKHSYSACRCRGKTF